ncbi:MAG: DUF3307 domain-containing protein [Armatimonadota bacterium]|nr:DUF3307 domain-containing protein [Armatimonadota bacterium]MDR7549461.1 DUF3307 domain-containing protein [Armatimonadota bacterium]
MSPWLYLVLAHLVADFIFQPYELVRLKRRPIGLAIHAGIHGVFTALVAAPIFPRWWLIVPILGVTHYLVDHMKVTAGKHDGPASVVLFLGDQAIHLAVLAAAVRVAGLPLGGEIPIGSPALTAVLYYAIPYVAVTFAGAILLYQVALAYRTRSSPEEFLTPRLRVAGYAERGLLLTVVLFLAPAFWVLGAAWYLLRFGLDRHRPGARVEVGTSLALTLVLGLLFRQG